MLKRFLNSPNQESSEAVLIYSSYGNMGFDEKKGLPGSY
jgi:hypothetical protein